jgi:hypothetical protein
MLPEAEEHLPQVVTDEVAFGLADGAAIHPTILGDGSMDTLGG